MTDLPRTDAGLRDERLAERVAELADRIARGETPDLGHLAKWDPGEAQALHRLLPAIRLLSELADEQETEDHAPWFVRPPEVLGDFKIGREIGRGVTGVVYEATQVSLGRRVAVKLLPPAALLDPRQLRRFEIEAQAAGMLQHPNIVPVYAHGNDRGVPYLAMRLIEGRSLAAILNELRERKGRGIHPREVAELGRQAAEALDYAHRNEVFHRDIKPSNFLVDTHERLWIVDFGLARVRGASELAAGVDVLGTLGYSSPEQAMGNRGAVDGRSDIYSLGATLYELLTARRAFEGVDRAALLNRIMAEEVRFISKLDAAIPVDIKTIVRKAMAKDPAERYATAGDLAEDLTLFLANQPILARPPALLPRVFKVAKRRWRAIAALGMLTILILSGAVAAAVRSSARLWALNERLALEKEGAERLAREAQHQARRAERSASGAQLRLAAQAVEAGQPERAQEILRQCSQYDGTAPPHSFVWRYLWRRASREVVVLAGPTPRYSGMGLSPDGKWLATSDGAGGIQLHDADTGALIRDMERAPGQTEAPVFSLDGSLIATAHRDIDPVSPAGFVIWEVASGRRLARLPMGQDDVSLACVFLRGGGFLALGQPSKLARFWSLGDDPSHPRLLEQVPRCRDIDFAPGESGFLTLESSSVIIFRSAVSGKPVRRFAVDGVGVNITGFASSRATEFVAAVSRPRWKLTLWDGQTEKLLASHAVPEHAGRLYFSPDGTKLATIDRAGDVHLIERTTGAVHRIGCGHSERRLNTRIAFSPDSTRIATVALGHEKGFDPAPVSIWETRSGRRLTTLPGRSEVVGSPIFTPDGRSLLVSSKTGVRRWRLAPSDDEEARQPAGHTEEAWSLAFSPDGRTLATGSDDSKPGVTVKLWDTASGRLTTSWAGALGTVAALAFAPDGRTLASGHLATADNVRIWDAATGQPLATLKGHTDRVRAVAFARDGASLASAGSDGTVRLWDVGSWRERSMLLGHADSVYSLAFSPDGNVLASASNDGDVRLWNLKSSGGSSAAPRVFHNRSHLLAVAFAPDGKTLTVADDTGTLTVWDVERSIPIRLIHIDGERLFHVAYHPDGTALAAAGNLGTIRLWDPETGQELLSMPGHRGKVHALAFSPDGSILGSVAHDGSVRLWRAGP